MKITSWQIQTLLKDQDAANKVKAAWKNKAAQRSKLFNNYFIKNMIEKTE